MVKLGCLDPQRNLCQHCGMGIVTRPRKLCQWCYSQLSIRNRFAPKVNGHTLRDRDFDSEDPTQEEMDRTIAEQMLCLPKWWKDESSGEFRQREVKKHWQPPVMKVGFKGNRRINGLTYQLGA